MLCRYKNVLGKPNEGIHSFRILDVAVVDVFMTMLLGIISGIIMNKSIRKMTLILFCIGILLHRLFCVNTTINMILFGMI